MNKSILVSVIIPTFNEEKNISDCLQTLTSQTYTPTEIIVVDDGSTDKTLEVLSEFRISNFEFRILRQNHQGPGAARNLGAKNARGEILVFVDGDMTFEKKFIAKLTQPIREGRVIGTFSKEERLKNVNNIWAVCWNINRQMPKDELITFSEKIAGFFWNIFTPAIPERMHHPKSFDRSPIFRAILKSEFEKIGGFTPTGEYTDDWGLSRKLSVTAVNAPGAVFFHSNPASLVEVWRQARWIGKNEFISGTLLRKIKSLIRYSLLASILIGFFKSVINRNPQFLIFKIWYDLAIFTSVVFSFFGEQKAK